MSNTINVIDGAEIRAYAMDDLDDEFSLLWEDHHEREARRAGLHARAYIALAWDAHKAAEFAREAFRAAAKVLACRGARAARRGPLTIRAEYRESAMSGAIGADGYCYSDADPGM